MVERAKWPLRTRKKSIKISEEKNKQMRNRNYTARRRNLETASWMRNRNTVRHGVKRLGTLSASLIIGLLVLIVGLIYVTQGTKATAYDYELSSIEAEINELSAKRDDLAVERARLKAIATSENSTVARAMESASPSGYAE